jgi:hypothetical protein
VSELVSYHCGYIAGALGRSDVDLDPAVLEERVGEEPFTFRLELYGPAV